MSDDHLDIDPEQVARIQARADRFKTVFHDHATGRIVLAELEQRFGSVLTVTEGGIDAVLATYRNLGRREILDWIAHQINIANGYARPAKGEIPPAE